MAESPHTDVLVVGAGPVGTALGASLGGVGVRTVVIDARPDGAIESSRATTVHAGTLERLDDALSGLGAEVAASGAWARRSIMWHGRRKIGEIRWDGMPTRYAAMVNLPQAEVERMLRSRLTARGGHLRWGCRVTALEQDADGVTVDVDTATGTESLRARFVVGCDGARSTVRHACGASLPGATYPERFLLADVDLDTSLDETCTHVFVSTHGVLGLMPMPHGWRLNGTLTDDEHLTPDTLPELVRARLGRAAEWVDLHAVGWANDYRTHSRLVDRYRAGRVFLAGDAAHLNSPVGGQGMNLGIMDALDLGQRLASVVVDGADDAVLDGYEAARRPAAARVLRLSRSSTRQLVARSPVERFARDQLVRVAHRLPPVQRRLSVGQAGLR
jgi:2-polyprenyl-6-methoxyphenol hydroxylase-like FAD-dependent oxidoreductase